MSDFHPLVARFGEVTNDYDARPTYPERVVELLRTECKLDGSSVVVDIGAGTGKLTEVIASETPNVVAVEPIAAMLDALQQKLPEVDARSGSAEQIPVEDQSVDVAVAGNAFHWFNDDKVWPELRRVLKPGGSVVAIWISRDRLWDWQRGISDAIEEYSVGSPAGNDDWSMWRPATRSGFGAVSGVHEQYELPFTRRRLLQMFSSFSFIANLDGDRRRSVLDRVVASAPTDAEDEVFPMKFDLDFYVVRRTS